jgi:hypothetical protein
MKQGPHSLRFSLDCRRMPINRKSKSTFPPGITFWNLRGVPVLMGENGLCVAYRGGITASHETLLEHGTQISEDEFFELDESQGRLQQSEFPAGTHFAELDGVPLVISPSGRFKALDGSRCSRRMLADGGRYLHEAEYLALVAIWKAKQR